MNKVKCKYCEKLYPSVVETDFTGECSDCSDLTIREQLAIQKKTRGYN